MRSIILFAILTVATLLVGCKKDGVPVDIANICAADNEKKYVVTSGFLNDRGSIFCSNIGGGPVECGVDVAAAAGGPKVFGAEIAEGTGHDSIEKLASGYKREDIKIHDDTGAVINLADKVKLTGQMSIVPDGSVCFMTVDRIEK